MKKLISMIMVLILALCGFSALAEADGGTKINCLIEDGSYIIQIDDPEGDLGWVADDMAQDDTVVKLYDADLIEDTFVVRYDPVADGAVTVAVRHYTGIACDEMITWDLVVEDGAVKEAVSGTHRGAPDESELDPFTSGEWLEQDTQFTSLSIEKNPERGWDVEAVSPATHGAYVFKTTIYYDCDVEAFVYDKGKFWDVPITDSDEAELGEAKIAGSTGSFTFGGDAIETATLSWHDDGRTEDVVFVRADATENHYGGYYTFEGSAVAMKLPEDFRNDTEEPAPGIFFSAINDDVLLQVQPVDGDFTDRDALMEYFNIQAYVIRATQLSINGVDLVYAEGADDDAMIYAFISPEGTTYAFVFIPQSENGLDAIEQIITSICYSDSL